MIKLIISDLSGVLLFPKEGKYTGNTAVLNSLGDKTEYNFDDYFVLNTELIDTYLKYKNQVKLCLFTGGGMLHEPTLRARLSQIFDRLLNSEEWGIGKYDPECFRRLMETFEVMPNEVVFIDDILRYTEVAQSLGINAILHEENTQTIKQIKDFVVGGLTNQN